MDTGKKRNELWKSALKSRLKKMYSESIRKRFLDSFRPLFCGSDELAKDQFGSHNESSNCNHPGVPKFDDKNHNLLVHIKNVITWLDEHLDVDNKTVKTNDVGEENSESDLYCTPPSSDFDYGIKNIDCVNVDDYVLKFKVLRESHDVTSTNNNKLNCSNKKSHSTYFSNTTVHNNVHRKKEHLGDTVISSNQENDITEVFNESLEEKDGVIEENNAPNNKNEILQVSKVINSYFLYVYNNYYN